MSATHERQTTIAEFWLKKAGRVAAAPRKESEFPIRLPIRYQFLGARRGIGIGSEGGLEIRILSAAQPPLCRPFSTKTRLSSSGVHVLRSSLVALILRRNTCPASLRVVHERPEA